MSNLILVDTALRLPSPDIEALIRGRSLVALPQQFIEPGYYALYPGDAAVNVLPLARYYRSSFLPIAQNVMAQFDPNAVTIKAWAKCDRCQIIVDTASLEILSELTIWTVAALREILVRRSHIFLAFFRVYLLSEPIEMSEIVHPDDEFVPLFPPAIVSQRMPVLSESIFTRRRQKLEKMEPPEHPELEALYGEIAPLSLNNPAQRALEREIQLFLGWAQTSILSPTNPDLTWIKTISQVGNSGDGEEFEKLVRRSLIELGFSGAELHPHLTAGPGGLDIYCEEPYLLVGTCKASSADTVRDETPTQLLKLGIKNLGKERFDCSLKLIVAAGELRIYTLRTARVHQMNVIRPETLERLVALQATYKGSVDLLELKQCLQQDPYGLADDKVNSYIDKVKENIELRSRIVKLIKRHLENARLYFVGVEAIHALYVNSSPHQQLNTRELYEILIELSSPLTGYLGRIKGRDWASDRFYYLRDLPVYG